MATLKNTTINDSGFVDVPVGNSSQRPSNPQTGDFRFNTDFECYECYNGSGWVKVY